MNLIRKYPYAILLAVQLLSLVFYGFFPSSHVSNILAQCIGLAVPVLAVFVVYRSPGQNKVAYILALLSISLSLTAAFSHQAQLLIYAHTFESLLYFYAAFSLVLKLFEDNEVTRDELFAVAATFTLLVWAFALLYSVCQQVYPQSIAAAVNPTQPRTWLELLFMSFSTMSSTGLGDIIPISPQARAISSLEIFSGVMYIAIIVSRVIALASAQKK